MDNVKSITIGFENCETITIPRKHIGVIFIQDIKTEIVRVACNAISKVVSANTVAIEIFSEGNVEYLPFGVSPSEMVFERINECHDITSIDVTYMDGSKETYWTDYESGDEEGLGAPNIYEKTKISDLGNLYVVISKDKDIKDFFSDEDINDSDNMQFIKDMLGVWNTQEE